MAKISYRTLLSLVCIFTQLDQILNNHSISVTYNVAGHVITVYVAWITCLAQFVSNWKPLSFQIISFKIRPTVHFFLRSAWNFYLYVGLKSCLPKRRRVSWPVWWKVRHHIHAAGCGRDCNFSWWEFLHWCRSAAFGAVAGRRRKSRQRNCNHSYNFFFFVPTEFNGNISRCRCSTRPREAQHWSLS